MERRRVTVELSVLTQRMSSREVERDVDSLVRSLKGQESGQTEVTDYDITGTR